MMSVDIDDMDAAHAVDGEIVEEHDEASDVDVESLADALKRTNTLVKAMHNFLVYVGNPLLCRAIGEKERKIIDRLTDKAEDLIEEVDGQLDQLE